MDDFANRFGGIARLYGVRELERLRAAHVCVVGVGGVGSWCVEALARSGLGAVTMIDLDDVCVTNVNRQLPALDGNFGRAKVEVLKERILAINPGCKVDCISAYLTDASANQLLAGSYDYVIDAIDVVLHKCALIVGCLERKLPILTVGGAGGRRDGTAVEVADLAFSKQDEMLRQVRRMLRQDFGFPESDTPFGVRCIFSQERPMYPWRDGTARIKREPGSDRKLNCASGFGTATFVTGAFGFAAAGEVVRLLTEGT